MSNFFTIPQNYWAPQWIRYTSILGGRLKCFDSKLGPRNDLKSLNIQTCTEPSCQQWHTDWANNDLFLAPQDDFRKSATIWKVLGRLPGLFFVVSLIELQNGFRGTSSTQSAPVSFISTLCMVLFWAPVHVHILTNLIRIKQHLSFFHKGFQEEAPPK